MRELIQPRAAHLHVNQEILFANIDSGKLHELKCRIQMDRGGMRLLKQTIETKYLNEIEKYKITCCVIMVYLLYYNPTILS